MLQKRFSQFMHRASNKLTPQLVLVEKSSRKMGNAASLIASILSSMTLRGIQSVSVLDVYVVSHGRHDDVLLEMRYSDRCHVARVESSL